MNNLSTLPSEIQDMIQEFKIHELQAEKKDVLVADIKSRYLSQKHTNPRYDIRYYKFHFILRKIKCIIGDQRDHMFEGAPIMGDPLTTYTVFDTFSHIDEHIRTIIQRLQSMSCTCSKLKLLGHTYFNNDVQESRVRLEHLFAIYNIVL